MDTTSPTDPIEDQINTPEITAKPITKRAKQLTNKQRKLVKYVLQGKSKAQAAISAGYSVLSSREIAQQTLALPHVQETMASIMVKAGLTDEAIADKINQLCKAKKTLYFADKGLVTDEREVEDHAIQRSSIELAAKIKGHLIDRSINLNVNVDATPISLNRYGRKQGKVDEIDT